MPQISVICTGKLKEQYLKDAQAEYLKRLSAFARVAVLEKRESALPQNPSPALIEKAVEEESAAILASVSGTLIALSPEGERVTSPGFASLINRHVNEGSISFAVGGSYGLGKELKQKAAKIISFSDMTFPHQLFRVMLLEQLYRAFMINEGRAYHK